MKIFAAKFGFLALVSLTVFATPPSVLAESDRVVSEAVVAPSNTLDTELTL